MGSLSRSGNRWTWLAAAAALLLSLLAATAASAAYTPATERIADDFRRDSALSACRHDAAALQSARAEVAADRTQGVPGLLGAIDAAIAARNGGACGDDQGGQDADPQQEEGAAATATPGATPAPDADATPEPDAGGAAAPGTATPGPGGQAGAAPTAPGGESAPAPTPAPAPAAPTPGPGSTPVVAPAATADDGMPAIVWILAGAALLLALLALLSLVLSRGRRGDEPLARTGHMWREAGYRAGSAWTDFSEWLRLGR